MLLAKIVFKSHAGTVVLKCFKGDNANQWKWEIRPPLPQKPPNRSSPKFVWVITSETPTPTQHFITIRLSPLALKYAKMRIK